VRVFLNPATIVRRIMTKYKALLLFHYEAETYKCEHTQCKAQLQDFVNEVINF